MEIKNLIHIEDEIMPYPILSSFIKWIAKNPDMFEQAKVTNGIDQKEVTILKYENSGFYKPHTDHCSGSPRTLSVVLFLNNDYEGGELVFKSLDYQKDILTVDVKPNRGIIFPSNFMFPHTVKPVSKGTRYAVVSWAL